MKVQVAMTVQYFTLRTFARGGSHRLSQPERIGPLAAVVHAVKPRAEKSNVATLDLIVWTPSGRYYLAKDVTPYPTTAIQHYWRPIPEEE